MRNVKTDISRHYCLYPLTSCKYLFLNLTALCLGSILNLEDKSLIINLEDNSFILNLEDKSLIIIRSNSWKRRSWPCHVCQGKQSSLSSTNNNKKILEGSGLTQWERAIANPKEKVKIHLIIIIIMILLTIRNISFKSLFQVVMQHTLMNSRSGFNSET